MTRASIYVRVSTGDQDTANQVLGLNEWAKNRGYEVVAIYKRRGVCLEDRISKGVGSIATGCKET